LPGKVDFDIILEASLEIDGTEDVEECEDENGKGVEITTEPSRTSAVAEEIKTRLPEVQVTSSVIAWVPNEDTMVELQEGSKAEEQLTKLLSKYCSYSYHNKLYKPEIIKIKSPIRY
jgi:transcriptional/translational regulatory protein YebC/TACO1